MRLSSLKAFICTGEKDHEDCKDATRDTENLWDLEVFKKTCTRSETAANKHSTSRTSSNARESLTIMLLPLCVLLQTRLLA